MKFKNLTFSLAAISALSMSIASAVRADDAEWYLGLGAGRSLSRLSNTKIVDQVNGPEFSTESVDSNDKVNAYKVFGGYQFTRYLALEGSYADLGHFSFEAQTAPTGTVSGDVRVRAFGLDLVPRLPITEQLSAFLKLGATQAQTRDSLSATGGNVLTETSPRAWRTNVKAGAGLQYLFTSHFGVRGEWERYRISDAVSNRGNIDLTSISLVFPFGRATPTTLSYVAPPAVVVERPAPVVAAPVPAAEPTPVAAPRHVTFSADALFAFDSAVIRPQGATDLDRFARELRDIHFNRVHVTGHTDRIGTEAYNQGLSQRRADAVRQYLVDNAGVDAGKIVADGKGSNDPVTAPGQCGAKRSKSTIECLQPDRRVDIEVGGTDR